jgi:hypothetical protein
MPKGTKRPRDPAQLAKLIVDIATGEVEDRELTPEESASPSRPARAGLHQARDEWAAAIGTPLRRPASSR